MSWNAALIRLTDRLPAHVKMLRRSLQRAPSTSSSGSSIEGIDKYCPPGQRDKRALIALVPEAWRIALEQYPAIRAFNFVGFTFEVVRALNESGFIVDLVDYRRPGQTPVRHYDLFLGHGGNCRSLIDGLPERTFILAYASGAYWKAFNRFSRERYDEFCRRKSLPRIATFVRSLEGTEDGEEYLARNADLVFGCGPRTMATWRETVRDVRLLYWAAYVDPDEIVGNRDYEAGRKNFLYVAGTSGNVQKGLDLLLEAFARCPDLHLHIDCQVEDEVLRAYQHELRLPNIHYVFHYHHRPLRGRYRALLQRSNFTISAPIDTGIGTAFIGSLGSGLIPVGYVDLEGDASDSVLSASPAIDDLVRTIRSASEKSAAWCRAASQKTVERYQRDHDPHAFARHFKSMIHDLRIGS